MTPSPLDADARQVRAALARCCDALQASAADFNALDARLGDGDLGTTLDKCAALMREVLATAPEGLQDLFKACAQACARASGSSFGTLLAVAFLTAARSVGDRPALDRSAIVALLDEIVRSLAQRGGAALGDKTMLDAIDAVARALDGESSERPDALRRAARQASADALDAFRGRPNRMGRARMFAERSIGLDDPGMVAVRVIVESV